MFFNVLSKPFITSPVFQMCFDKEYFVGLDLPGRDDGGDGSNTGRSEWRMQFTIRYIIRHWYGTRFLLLCVKTCALRFYRSADNPPPLLLTFTWWWLRRRRGKSTPRAHVRLALRLVRQPFPGWDFLRPLPHLPHHPHSLKLYYYYTCLS